jgi:hypothetical protein
MSKENKVELTMDELENTVPKNPKKTRIVSGASYHDFEATPIFVGTYIGEHHSEKVEDDFKVIGYDFITLDGEEVIISNSHSITKALDTEIDGTLVRELNKPLEIQFLGKIMSANGKPFNRFSVSLLG